MGGGGWGTPIERCPNPSGGTIGISGNSEQPAWIDVFLGLPKSSLSGRLGQSMRDNGFEIFLDAVPWRRVDSRCRCEGRRAGQKDRRSFAGANLCDIFSERF